MKQSSSVALFALLSSVGALIAPVASIALGQSLSRPTSLFVAHGSIAVGAVCVATSLVLALFAQGREEDRGPAGIAVVLSVVSLPIAAVAVVFARVV